MADQLDIADKFSTAERESTIAIIRKNAELPKGTPGDCDLCGEWSGRLIKGACAPCRDRRGLA